MLPCQTLPVSRTALRMVFQPCFTAPTYRTFCGLASGFLAQTGRRTVCGMLTGRACRGCGRMTGRILSSPGPAGRLSGSDSPWPAWSSNCSSPKARPVLVAIDDTLFKRRGKEVWAASWFHDGSAIGAHPVGYGNNWVILGIVVTLPFCSRPVCLPVLARLVVKNTTSASRLYLARAMIEALAEALPSRTIHGVGDACAVPKPILRFSPGLSRHP
jgi:hypothetical protein